MVASESVGGAEVMTRGISSEGGVHRHVVNILYLILAGGGDAMVV